LVFHLHLSPEDPTLLPLDAGLAEDRTRAVLADMVATTQSPPDTGLFKDGTKTVAADDGVTSCPAVVVEISSMDARAGAAAARLVVDD